MEDEFAFGEDVVILDEREEGECFEDDDEEIEEEEEEDLGADPDPETEADPEAEADVVFEFLRSRKKPAAAPRYEGVPLEPETDPE